MKIVVCVKQVPDTKGGVKFKPDGTLDRAAMLTIMNPDDKAGLEAALRLKDQYGAEVTVVTMGLPKAEEVLREALAMGADKGILVTDRVLGGADTWATSTTIAGAISRYAPPSENNTAGYHRRIEQLTGLSINKRMSDLSASELTAVANAIRTIEGWEAGTVQRI